MGAVLFAEVDQDGFGISGKCSPHSSLIGLSHQVPVLALHVRLMMLNKRSFTDGTLMARCWRHEDGGNDTPIRKERLCHRIRFILSAARNDRAVNLLLLLLTVTLCDCRVT